MRQEIAHRLFWGFVLISIGVVFLLNQIGAITMDIGDLLGDFWPVFLIFFGLQGLLLQRGSGSWWNLLLIAIGAYFLGRNLGWVSLSPGEFFRFMGPVAIILVGLGMILRGYRPRRSEPEEPDNGWWPVVPPPPPSWEPPNPHDPHAYQPGHDPHAHTAHGHDPHAHKLYGHDPHAHDPSGTSVPPHADGPRGPVHGPGHGQPGPAQPGPADRPEPPRDGWRRSGNPWKQHGWQDWGRGGWGCNGHSRFIGDTFIGHDHWELRPMNISHFIGDTVLDLTKAQIPVGETKIHISSFIGDVKVYVPNDFSVGVQVNSSCLIGDVAVLDRRQGGLFNQVTVETPAFADAPKRIVFVVSAFIGDVRVTKVG